MKSKFNQCRHAVARAAILATATLAVTGAARANSAEGGSSNTPGGNGFGCASGTYQMDNGIARCTLPAPTGLPTSNCAASVLTQGACAFNFPTTTSGSSPVISNSNPGFTGTARATCQSGTWGSLSASCTPSACNGANSTFGACSFAVPALASGQSVSVTNTASGLTGTETATCTNGALIFSAQICTPTPAPCSSGTMTWDTTCSGAIPVTASGGSSTVINVASGYTGQATFGCSDGSWQAPSSSSCLSSTTTPTPPTTLAPNLGLPSEFVLGCKNINAKGSLVLNFSAAGTWSAATSCSAGISEFSGGTSGTWATDAAAGVYEVQVSPVSGSGSTTPTVATNWTPITGNMIVARAQTPGGWAPTSMGTWKVSIRKVGTTAPVVTNQIPLIVENLN